MLASIAAGFGPATPALAIKSQAAAQKRLKKPVATLAGGIPAVVPGWRASKER